jgi:succinate-semialdehyde dehydrogenase/glutarate-semialdehyde dehydrogenase
MTIDSINPANGQLIQQHTKLTASAVNDKLVLAQRAFIQWKKVSLRERSKLLARAGEVLRENNIEYAKMITDEMGKPFTESKSEIEKCAWVCDYYAERAATFLADEQIKTDAQKSFVRHDPLGTILAIMPWNFPFWQVFRFAAPTLTAGNTGLLKHASNVFGSAQLIEDVFTKAGYPIGVFQNLITDHDLIEKVIQHDTVKAVSVTGSEKAGASVASIAAKEIKKSVLELGGSNAFIVWEDADIDHAVKVAVNARMLNSGQSCIAAKRFIVLEAVYDEFVEKFIAAVRELKMGDPMLETTQVGPLARKDLADKLHQQVQDSVKAGATLAIGGKQTDCFYTPTVLTNVTEEMAAFKEETFGPLAAIIKAKNIKEAFRLSENSRFGLGVSIFTKDVEKALSLANEVSDGALFINDLVKSDPRLPFGGTKSSGFGRELSKDGILEFVNRKTVYVKT